jgi:hypothetical protein
MIRSLTSSEWYRIGAGFLLLAVLGSVPTYAQTPTPAPLPYGECKISLDARIPVRIVGRVPLQSLPNEINVSRVDFNNDNRFDAVILDSAGVDVVEFLSTAQLAGGSCVGGATLTAVPMVDPIMDPALDVTTLQLSTDNFMDLATGNPGGTALIPNNNGTLVAQNAIGNGAGGGSGLVVAAADFDGDDKEDLVIGTDTSVRIKYGLSALELTNAVPIPNTSAVGLLIVAYLNQDTLPDLVVVGRNGAISIIENLGNRSFDTPRPLGGSLDNPVAIAVGDFDENGTTDLAIVDGPGVSTRVPRPTTASASPSPTATPTRKPTDASPTPSAPTATVPPTSTATHTFTVTLTPTRTPIMTPGFVHIFLQNTPLPTPGPVSFVDDDSYGAGRGPAAVAVSDFNGDRHADFVVSSVSDDRVMFFYGDGTGSFVPGDPCQEDTCTTGGDQVAGCCVGAGPRAILVTMFDDLSAGARPDLLVGNADGHSISVLLSSNPATGTPTNTPTITTTPGQTNTPSLTRTITRTPKNTDVPTKTCPPSGVCVQGEGCVNIIAPQRSLMMLWPWIGAAALWLLRRRVRE